MTVTEKKPKNMIIRKTATILEKGLSAQTLPQTSTNRHSAWNRWGSSDRGRARRGQANLLRRSRAARLRRRRPDQKGPESNSSEKVVQEHGDLAHLGRTMIGTDLT